MFNRYLKVNNEEITRYNFFTLRFLDDENCFENEFNNNYYKRFYSHIRMCHWYAMIFYCGMGFLDFLLYPDLVITYCYVRLGVVCLFFMGFFLSFFDLYMKHTHYISAFYILMTGSGFIYMAAITPGLNIWPHFIGIIICYIFGYTFIRVRVIYAFVAGWGLLVIYATVIYLVKSPDRAFLISSVFMLATINVLGILICYTLEFSARRDFILNKLIDTERQKVADSNEELQLANKKLERMSYSDGLTGIANRRLFDKILHNDYGRCARDGKPLTLILMDIDCFKLYNDFYGHFEGDQCLKNVALVIAGNCKRPTDLAARYGGEEFAVILCDNEAESADHICREIQKDLKVLAILHEKSSVGKYVTLSMGVACIHPKPNDPVSLIIDAADKALYEAKNNGRNCMVIAQDNDSR